MKKILLVSIFVISALVSSVIVCSTTMNNQVIVVATDDVSRQQVYTASKGNYVILSEEKSFSEQVKNKTNTFFEIRHLVDLNGEIIKLPSGCVLLFRGGALKNGGIIGSNTIIEAPNYQVFMEDCNVSGSFANTQFQGDWFANLQYAIDLASNNSGNVQLSPRVYTLDKTLNIKSGISLVGCGNEGAFRDNRGTILRYDGSTPVVSLQGSAECPVKNVIIRNIKIRGNGRDFHAGTNVGLYVGPRAYYCIFENVSIYACSNGIEMENAWSLRFESVNPYYCENGFFLNNKSKAPLTTSSFSTCVAYNSNVGFNMSADMNAVTLVSCGTDGCATSMELAGCFGVSVISYEFEQHTKCGIHINNSDCYVTFVGLSPRGLGDQSATLIKVDNVGRATFNEMYISKAVAPKDGFSFDIKNGMSSKVSLSNVVINGKTRNTEGCSMTNSVLR